MTAKPLMIIQDTKNISEKKASKMIKKFIKSNSNNEELNLTSNEVYNY
jgi:hypothetical protein